MYVFTLGELSAFTNFIKDLGKYEIVSLDLFLPTCKSHEEFETVVKEPGFFDKYIQNSPEEVNLVINPTESSGITLVFIHELLEAGKMVNVHVLGRWKRNTVPNRFIFRLVFGILQEKAAITENLHLSLFPQDVYALSYKGSVIDENSEMQKVFGNVFHTKNVFSNSTEKVSMSGDFSGDFDAFQYYSSRSKVSCLARVGVEQLNQFQNELKKMMDLCDLKCEVIRRDFYCSGEETPNEKIEKFLADSPTTVNNLRIYSLGKPTMLFEVFFA
jgi:hypothetical protein